MEFTNSEKRDAALREANLRRRVYPRWIEQGKLREVTALREIAVMDAIAEDYKSKAAADDPTLELERRTT